MADFEQKPSRMQMGQIGGGPGLAVPPTDIPSLAQVAAAPIDPMAPNLSSVRMRNGVAAPLAPTPGPYDAEQGERAGVPSVLPSSIEQNIVNRGTAAPTPVNIPPLSEAIIKDRSGAAAPPAAAPAAPAAAPTGPTSTSWTGNTNVANLAQKSNMADGSGIASFQNKDGTISNTLLTGASGGTAPPSLGNAAGIASDQAMAAKYDQRQKDDAAYRAGLPDYVSGAAADRDKAKFDNFVRQTTMDRNLKDLANRGPRGQQIAAQIMSNEAIAQGNNQTSLATNANTSKTALATNAASNATTLQGHAMANQPAMARLAQEQPGTLEDLKTKQFANANAQQLQETRSKLLDPNTSPEESRRLSGLYRDLIGKPSDQKIATRKTTDPVTGLPNEENYVVEPGQEPYNVAERAKTVQAQQQRQRILSMNPKSSPITGHPEYGTLTVIGNDAKGHPIFSSDKPKYKGQQIPASVVLGG